jgi:phospholipase C
VFCEWGPYQFISCLVVILALTLLAGCGGTATSPAQSTPNPSPTPATVTIQFAASPNTISAGQTAKLSWNTTNATSVTISPGVSGSQATSGSIDVSPATTTTYTATATGANGTTATATVTVTAALVKPAITLTATPTTVTAGQFSTLAWQSTGATSATISPSVTQEDSQALPLSGSTPVVPNTTTTYTATATGPGGTATATVTVTVTQPVPTLTLTAQPGSIIAGQNSTLTWSSKNAITVTIDHGVGGVAVTSGTVNVSPAATTTYTATATGPGGSITATATVTVQQQLGITLTAAPTSIASGQSSTLMWASQQATSVSIDQGIGTVNLSGSTTVRPAQTTNYTATAKDAGGNTKTATATVTLLPSGTFQNSIKHIIYLVQENRSFDNYFGFLGQYKTSKGYANDPPIDGLPSTTVQLDKSGASVHPYHYQTQCVENTSPSWNPSWFSYNGGKMDGFVSVQELPTTTDPMYHRAMGYYDQTDLPYYYELASQFATSDRFFESGMAGTIPNRMYLFTGTSFGHIFPDPPPQGGFPQKTIFGLMNDHNINWRYYFQDNSIFLGQFTDWNAPGIQSRVVNIDDWYATLARPDADDALPSVIFIEHAAGTDIPSAFDEHPGTKTQQGVARVKLILDALMKSTAWKSSVFIITYDEAGGLYDHVPIQSAPAPDNIQPIASPGFETPLPGDFAHTGFRIPLIVVSPWVRPHFNSRTVRDLTSILKLIEFRFGLPPLTARDAWADNMIEFFDFTNPAWLTPPTLPAQPSDAPCNFDAELTGQN